MQSTHKIARLGVVHICWFLEGEIALPSVRGLQPSGGRTTGGIGELRLRVSNGCSTDVGVVLGLQFLPASVSAAFRIGGQPLANLVLISVSRVGRAFDLHLD